MVTWTRTGPCGAMTRTRLHDGASGIGVASTSKSAASSSSRMVPVSARVTWVTSFAGPSIVTMPGSMA